MWKVPIPSKPFPVQAGLSAAQIVPGALVTISASKLIRDRSYSDGVFRVLAATPTDVVVEATNHFKCSWFGRGPIKLTRADREFYDAEVLVAQMENERPALEATNQPNNPGGDGGAT